MTAINDGMARILRAELLERGVGYRELSRSLARNGVDIPPRELERRIAAGDLTRALFIQCLEAAGAPTIYLDF